jgi:hypothetical protein
MRAAERVDAGGSHPKRSPHVAGILEFEEIGELVPG